MAVPPRPAISLYHLVRSPSGLPLALVWAAVGLFRIVAAPGLVVGVRAGVPAA